MIKNNRIYTFLLLTFAWSWIIWLIGLNHLSDGINQESIGKFLIFFYAGVYGPSASALITAIVFDGFKGFLKLVKKLIIWKVQFKIYLYVIILPLVFVSIGILLYSQFIGDIGRLDSAAYLTIPIVLWVGLYAGPLGEELGWRGFLLPELQNKNSNLKSAIIIGVIWFLWYIPLWWAPFGTLVSGGSISVLPVITYFLMIICLSIIITWLVVEAWGSVLIAILFHLSINAGIALLFFPELNRAFREVHMLSSVGLVIITVFLVERNKLNIRISGV